MPLTPGVCLACGKDAWRRATHAKTGESYALWPDPLSTYASAQTETGYAPGLPYCRQCRPIIGTPLLKDGAPLVVRETVTLGNILDVVPAPVRYGAWYEPQFRAWLGAWLKDHLELSDTEAAPILAQWEQDTRLAKGLYARSVESTPA